MSLAGIQTLATIWTCGGPTADAFTIATCRLKGDRFGDGHCILEESTAKVAAGPVEEESANGIWSGSLYMNKVSGLLMVSPACFVIPINFGFTNRGE